MRIIPPSELIINDDGSVFHLHLRPEQLADIVLLVGDPGRVELVASRFESRECEVENREFRSVTGLYKGRRMTILSTGIGVGNIDITMTEIDALANVDFERRCVKDKFKQLTIVRLGTSGGLQSDIKVGDMVFARTSLGFDGLLSYYAGNEQVRDLALERAFKSHTQWSGDFPPLYAVDADEQLAALFADCTMEGITIASPGFYAPQGRSVRLRPVDEVLNSKIESFIYDGQRRVTNYEMESSVLAGMARLMGHRGATICTIIAQRVVEDMCTDYHPFVEQMIDMVLNRLANVRD
ncbi:MAG: nucleoside phosphorylase [Rikenellaceae bacterium]